MRTFGSLLFETLNQFLEDKAQRLGAALAYYAAFSIAPLLVLMVAIAGLFYREDALGHVQSQIGIMTGEGTAETIVSTMRGMNSGGGGLFATVVSVITLLIGATGMFGQLQDAMNTIWEVTPKPRRIWVDILR